MSVDELAEELAEFWFSALAEADWEMRLFILKEIYAQLLVDLESKAECEALAPRLVAAIIERLGAPPVANIAQAKIYASSSDQRHREAAKVWGYREQADGPETRSVSNAAERRRHARTPVDVLSEIWVLGRPAPCRLLDLSIGGARLRVREPAPDPGTEVRLTLPDTVAREARVVFRNSVGIGVEFIDQPAAA